MGKMPADVVVKQGSRGRQQKSGILVDTYYSFSTFWGVLTMVTLTVRVGILSAYADSKRRVEPLSPKHIR